MNQTPGPPLKLAAGCVVYRTDGDGAPLVLLIYDKYGRWTLPKGHLKQGETEQAAAQREVFEETGLSGELGPLISRIRYTVLSQRGLPRPKQVAFFLMRAHGVEARPQQEEGIGAAEWFTPEDALGCIGYPLVREVLAQAISMLPQAP
ncbi:MAG TPA: NUDIX hydrolase [Roseiflexaceae bacterium]|nr:NUDIX hydrolase [Roseiflexaceae bacterium]